MGSNTKISTYEATDTFPQSRFRFSLPTWAQILAAAPRHYERDVEIFGQQEPAECLYRVVSGAVRTFSVTRDGRRHIAGFHLDGEFFGLEADSRHALSAETICNSKILIIKRSMLVALAEHDKDIARRLTEMMREQLLRANVHVKRLVQTSCERVADFLLEMAEHSRDADKVELPMSRREIADHLGLTIETVSRSFARLETINAISRASPRHVILLDRAALKHAFPST
jgi:CRP/FNR family nitrogen fixation transcriptional regulator